MSDCLPTWDIPPPSSAAPVSPATLLATKSFVGGRLSWTSVQVVTAAAGRCADSTGAYPMSWSGNLTADLDAVGNGAGKLDTGSATISAWYVVWFIGKSTDPTATQLMFSLSATAPAMPAGYDIKRRHCIRVRNDSSGNIKQFATIGNGKDAVCHWILTSGSLGRGVLAAGGATDTNGTAVDCTILIPPDDCEAELEIATNGITTLLAGLASAIVMDNISANRQTHRKWAFIGTQSLYYYVASSTVSMSINSFRPLPSE